MCPQNRYCAIYNLSLFGRAAEALVELLEDTDLKRRATFPESSDIRAVSLLS